MHCFLKSLIVIRRYHQFTHRAANHCCQSLNEESSYSLQDLCIITSSNHETFDSFVFCNNLIKIIMPFHVAVQIVGGSYQGIIMQVNIVMPSFQLNVNIHYTYIIPILLLHSISEEVLGGMIHLSDHTGLNGNQSELHTISFMFVDPQT